MTGRYWFRRRGYSRWSLPATWEGWLAYALHLAVVITAAALAPTGVALAVLVLATVVLVVVAARFGEPPGGGGAG